MKCQTATSRREPGKSQAETQGRGQKTAVFYRGRDEERRREERRGESNQVESQPGSQCAGESHIPHRQPGIVRDTIQPIYWVVDEQGGVAAGNQQVRVIRAEEEVWQGGDNSRRQQGSV